MVCGKAVDARGLHDLACGRSPPRQQRHSHLASHEARTDSRSQRTSGFDVARWETSRWHHHPPLVEGQAISLGRYGARGTCGEHSQRSGSNSQTMQRPTRTPSTASYLTLMCSFRRTLRQGVPGTIMRWNCSTGDWKTDGQHYMRCQGVHLPVPAAVRGTTEGKCGLISKLVPSQLARCNPLLHFLMS